MVAISVELACVLLIDHETDFFKKLAKLILFHLLEFFVELFVIANPHPFLQMLLDGQIVLDLFELAISREFETLTLHPLPGAPTTATRGRWSVLGRMGEVDVRNLR